MHAHSESMETLAVHGGERRPGPEGSVVYPIYQATASYGGTHDFLTHHAGDLGWRYSFVDVHRPETWTAARTPQTRAFLVDTITNPLMRVGLLREIAGFARREGLLSVIDNTFATPDLLPTRTTSTPRSCCPGSAAC